MAFKERMSRPEAGNPYYNRKANGGYSNAIKGSPTDSGCDVLHNCVGYAYGRFNEIGGYGSCKYLAPVNAENFMQYKGSCKTGMEPKVGACMVWQKGATLSGSDGAGHVAIVERVVSPTQVITSESGWEASKPFWTQTRNKGNGNWGAGSGYTFLGFIYNPAVTDADTKVTPTTGETVYTVQAGDTLSGIASRYGTTYQALAQYNGIADPNIIRVGQQIRIPGTAPVEKKTETAKVPAPVIQGEAFIYKYLTEKAGLNCAAACGILANLAAESGFKSTNLQNSYESKLGYNDDTYTAAVDNGSYTNFVKDAAGYGLAQWTFWSRKQALLDYAKSVGKSIGDTEMQLGFFIKEIKGYTSVWNCFTSAPNTAQGAYDCGYKMCYSYEAPAAKETSSVTRGNNAKTYFAKYGQSAAPATPTQPTTPASSDTVYTVKPGDTLSGIAAKYGTTYQKLAEYNGIPDPNKINVGQKIKIPSAKASSTTSGGQSAGQSTGASAGTSEIKAGRKVTLKNTPCYSSATVKQSFGTKTGDFYLWDGQAISGRYRITNKPENVGKAGQVTCYIDAGVLNGTVVSQPQAAPKVLTDADFNVGDKVIVNGPIYYGGNGGNSINKVSATMYVVGKVNAKAFKYCIGVAATKGGARQGWAAPGILKKG